ncbi:unnamed protein product, partial [marine sediment metagenome]
MKTIMISKTILHMIHDLKTDKTSGASELIEIALEILEAQLHTIKDPNIDIKEVIFEISKELFNIRPSMAPIINTIGYFIHDLEFFSKQTLLEKLKTFPAERLRIDNALTSSFHSFLDRFE